MRKISQKSEKQIAHSEFIDDRGALTVPELKSKLRKLKIEKG